MSGSFQVIQVLNVNSIRLQSHTIHPLQWLFLHLSDQLQRQPREFRQPYHKTQERRGARCETVLPLWPGIRKVQRQLCIQRVGHVQQRLHLRHLA